MLDSLQILFIMDGKGPYVWSCLLILIIIITINIIIPVVRLKRIYREGTLEELVCTRLENKEFMR
jgi:heme exporter protein D